MVEHEPGLHTFYFAYFAHSDGEPLPPISRFVDLFVDLSSNPMPNMSAVH